MAASGRRPRISVQRTPEVRDPFPTTADPGDYVPREATERALGALARGLELSKAPIALSGPACLGKTLLTRVLTQRLRGRFETVLLPYPALPPEPLCAWALRELGEDPGDNPEAELVETAQRLAAAGRPLLVVVDDAGALPVPSARGLSDLGAISGDALRLLVVTCDQRGSAAVLAALDPDLREVRLTEPMSEEETTDYIRQRLGRAGVAPEIAAHFDQRQILRLHRESGGVPGALNRLAARVSLEGGQLEVGLPAPGPKRPPPEGPPLEFAEGLLEDSETFLGPDDLEWPERELPPRNPSQRGNE